MVVGVVVVVGVVAVVVVVGGGGVAVVVDTIQKVSDFQLGVLMDGKGSLS